MERALSFSVTSVGTSSVAITVSNSSSVVTYNYVLYCETYGGDDPHSIGSRSGSIGPGGNSTTGYTGLWYATYRVKCYQEGVHVQTLYFTISPGGGTSGGGSSSGSWSGGSKTKTNTVSWNTSTAAGTSFANSAGSYSSYGTRSLISSDSSWYGESWVWARLDSVENGDVDVTYTITQGARTHNIADWPYHGISIKYTDTDNVEQTYLNLPATSSGVYWANATNESGYNYVVKAPFVNTIKLTFRKSLSAAYNRVITIRFYNDHSYWCSLGGMYQWENILKITLNVPKRTKYIASVNNGNGGTATVNNTTPEVYVSSGTSVTYRATPDSSLNATFSGWYLPENLVYDEVYGFVPILGATPVSTSATYSKSITSDYELVAIFDYVVDADWDPTKATSNTWVKVNGTWVQAQPYYRNSTSNSWERAVSLVG